MRQNEWGSRSRSIRRRLFVGLFMTIASACGARAEGEFGNDYGQDYDNGNITGELGRLRQALGDDWAAFEQLPTNANGFDGSPAVCDAHGMNEGQGQGSAPGWTVVGRDDSTNRYRYSHHARGYTPTEFQNVGWRQFSSKPACTSLDDALRPDGTLENGQYAILGRGTDNKYYIYIHKVYSSQSNPPFMNLPPDDPETVLFFTKINDDTWASAPAATIAGGALVLVGRRSDNKIWGMYNTLTGNQQQPYDSNNWTSAAVAPNLPAGYVIQGDPAITNVFPWIGSVTIATRGTKNGTHKLFFTQWNGNSFSAWAEFPTGSIAVDSDSDPALAVDGLNGNGVTLFFRGADDKVYQGSGLGTVGFSFQAINDPTNQDFARAPAAVGSLLLEGTHRVVIAKPDQQFYMTADR